MTVMVLLVLVAGVALSGYFGVRLVGQHRKPRELRGDWWTGFEREFRTYARKAAISPPYDHRRQGNRESSGR